jgi:hypothetical protein
LNHKESFEDNEFETELLEELTDNPEISIAEVDELFKDYAFTNYDDNLRRFSGTGTFAAVVKIIYKESKDCPFQVSAGSNEILDLPSFVYVNEDEYSNKNFLVTEKKDAIDNYLKKYAYELHVPSYGSTFVYYSSEFDNEDLYDQKELSYDWEMFLS